MVIFDIGAVLALFVQESINGIGGNKMSIIDSSITINTMHLNNRLVMPPMATAKADGEGNVTDELISYYEEKAKGGYIGMIIVEFEFISQQGKAHPRQVSIADDSKIEGLKRLTDAVHDQGCKVIAQIVHGGGATNSEITGMETVSPSCIPFRTYAGGERALTAAEIETIVSDFAKAAVRAKKAGFDGVEIHSAHGYLLNQFCSPYTNRRTDEYGGTVEKRLKIHKDVIKAVREAVGEDYPILMRLGAYDDLDGGNKLAEAVEMAEILSDTSLDALDISGGLMGYMIKGREDRQGYLSDVTKAIKEKVSIPVILVGGVTDIHAADQLIADGCADMVGVGRAMLNDSEWAKKAFAEL